MDERTQIAAMALQGILANSETEKCAQEFDVNLVGMFGLEEADKKYAKAIALSSVAFADELILALDKDYKEITK